MRTDTWANVVVALAVVWALIVLTVIAALVVAG